MSYLFFFSYAREDYGKKLRMFYNDITTEISQRLPESKENIGFRDESNVKLGQKWPEALSQALRTARLFVYIHSAAYFNRSDWCGKEWHFFRMRVEQYMEDKKTCDSTPPVMIPVLWNSKCDIPPCAKNIQFTHEEFGKNYKDYGLHSIMMSTIPGQIVFISSFI